MILKPPVLEFTGEYAFLSNFYNSPFPWEGIMWKTSEHAYQAAKTKDWNQALVVRNAATPGQAKRLGKMVTKREDWEEIKDTVMELILWHKFGYNPDILQKLLDTYPAHLEEGNTWGDNYWGVCPVASGRGRNQLGKTLMKIRDECIKNEVKPCNGNFSSTTSVSR